jgi:hypothetical protein
LVPKKALARDQTRKRRDFSKEIVPQVTKEYKETKESQGFLCPSLPSGTQTVRMDQHRSVDVTCAPNTAMQSELGVSARIATPTFRQSVQLKSLGID